MLSETKRAVIRRTYRGLRNNIDKTQLEVEALARLDTGRYWKIENGLIFPTDAERARLARVFKVEDSALPSDATLAEAKAS